MKNTACICRHLDLRSPDLQGRRYGVCHSTCRTITHCRRCCGIPASEKILFAGDLVFRNRIPFVGQADSKHWIEALQNLLLFDTQWVIPGHGPISNDPKADMTLTRDYLLYLRESMGRAADDMEPFENAYAKTDWSKFEKFPLFKSANRMNAYNTYLLMEQQSK